MAQKSVFRQSTFKGTNHMASYKDILTVEDIKATAKIIKDTLKNKFNIEIKQGWALETSSAIYGYKDWNTASADLVQIADELKLSDEVFRNMLESFDPRSKLSSGFISETAFDGLLAKNAKKYGLSKSDSMIKTTSIQQVAEEIGIGKDLLFTIGHDTKKADEITISENTSLADFGLLIGNKRRTMRLALLAEMEAPQEVVEHEKTREIQLLGLNIHGVVGPNEIISSIFVSSPNTVLDDFVYSIIRQTYGDDANYSVYIKGVETERYRDAFKNAYDELFRNLPSKLYQISISSAHNYREGIFMAPDFSIFQKYSVDDFGGFIKNELSMGDNKEMIRAIKKQAKALANIIVAINEEQK